MFESTVSTRASRVRGRRQETGLTGCPPGLPTSVFQTAKEVLYQRLDTMCSTITYTVVTNTSGPLEEGELYEEKIKLPKSISNSRWYECDPCTRAPALTKREAIDQALQARDNPPIKKTRKCRWDQKWSESQNQSSGAFRGNSTSRASRRILAEFSPN
jgi:hypothetical protein